MCCKMALKCDLSDAFLLVSPGFWVWGAGPQRESSITSHQYHITYVMGEISMVGPDAILDLNFVSQKGWGTPF